MKTQRGGPDIKEGPLLLKGNSHRFSKETPCLVMREPHSCSGFKRGLWGEGLEPCRESLEKFHLIRGSLFTSKRFLEGRKSLPMRGEKKAENGAGGGGAELASREDVSPVGLAKGIV